MKGLVVSDLDEPTREGLRSLANRQGKSVEEIAREILAMAVVSPPKGAATGLGSRIADRFQEVGLDSEIDEFRGDAIDPPGF